MQEEGVDEPDIVKTDGNTLYAVANGKLNAVDVSDPKPRLLDTLALNPGQSHELLLHGDRLLVLSRGGYWIEPLPAIAARIAPWQPAQSVLSEINVSDPKRLRLVRTLTLDGSYVAARLVGGSVRIVASSQVPGPLPYVQPKSGTKEDIAAAARQNRAVVASSRVTSWLPTYRIRRAGAKAGKPHPLVQCRHVSRPVGFSGLGMLTVLTVDLTKGLEPVDSISVMTDARIVYASPKSLYVSTELWADRPSPDKPTTEKDGVQTQIHKFDISSPQRTQYRGSGSVTGYLLSQWSLSEFKGVLRVVSTSSPAWWTGGQGESESFLTTLRASGGALVQAGRIGELGKGERVYAVRFVGDTGYVVQADRPALHGRSGQPGAPARARRAEVSRATRRTCIRSARTCCSASARTRPRRAVRPAPRFPCSTSPTCASRPGCTPPRSAWAGRRRSPTTTRSSTGRARAWS